MSFRLNYEKQSTGIPILALHIIQLLPTSDYLDNKYELWE